MRTSKKEYPFRCPKCWRTFKNSIDADKHYAKTGHSGDYNR